MSLENWLVILSAGLVAVASVVFAIGAVVMAVRDVIARRRQSSHGYEAINWDADWNLVVPDWFDDPRYDMTREELWGDIYDLRDEIHWQDNRYALRVEQMAELVAENARLMVEVGRLTRLKKRYWRRIQRLTDPHTQMEELEAGRAQKLH